MAGSLCKQTASPRSTLTVAPLTDSEFRRFQKLIHETAGIYLSSAKKALLEARLQRRVRELGLNSFAEYYRDIVEEGNGDELISLLDRISTNETCFFREPRHFEFLQQSIIPQWAARALTRSEPQRVRVWSAGCATGEEPYSLAMMLLEHFSLARAGTIEILATDLSSRALEIARAGIWPIAKSSQIPLKYLKRFMLKGIGAQSAKMKAAPELQSVIRFERLNLNDAVYPVIGRFDAIFCRNVLIYFDAGGRARVVQRLLSHLSPSGCLFIGHAESLIGIDKSLRQIVPTVYGRAEYNFARAEEREISNRR